MNDIEALTDRVILIGKGRILHDGSFAEIRGKHGDTTTTEEVIAALYQAHNL
jgi:ABC-2 type transport system ATP-binding protein